MYKYPYGDSQQLNLDWILAKLKELEEAGLGLDLEEVSNALISLTYNTSTAYRRYDYAFLNGKLYRCLSDTSGAFDPAAWQEALIGDDLAVLTRWINAIDAAAVVDVKFDTSGTNGKLQQKYHDQYHDVVEVDYSPVQNSKRPLSSNAGYELNGAINTLAALRAKMGAKNLLPFPYEEDTKITHGITYTVNSDSSITINGTNTHTEMVHFNLSLGINWAGYRLHLIYDTPDSNISMHYNNSVQALSLDVAYQATINNVTVYPMVLDYDETVLNPFEKYAKTNVQLTEDIGNLSGAINAIGEVYNGETATDSIPNNTETTTKTMTVPKGVYLVNFYGSIYSPTTDGIVQMAIKLNNTNQTAMRVAVDAANTIYRLPVTAIVNVTAPTGTITSTIYHTCGSTLNSDSILTALKMK